ncbi:hypothetical protein [Hymenobacter sp. PAMC 26628]|uniref:hypothetical protein n=1 Tax=Hymenobacter sp. PAMC 26628 TaxID=1484118 RepID=UPI000B204CD5|nr:hypothetical protein [Hymenobacter sp. PAMC 26628]
MKIFPLPNPASLPVAARWGQRRAVLLLSALLALPGARAAHAQDTPWPGCTRPTT